MTRRRPRPTEPVLRDVPLGDCLWCFRLHVADWLLGLPAQPHPCTHRRPT